MTEAERRRELRAPLLLEIATEIISQAHRSATLAEEWIRAVSANWRALPIKIAFP